MTNDTDQRVDDTTAPAPATDAQPQDDRRMREHNANTKSIAVIPALVVAGTAVVLTVLPGSATSTGACEEKVRGHVRTVLLGVDPSRAGKPVTCDGIPQAEVEQIRGRILGTAVA